MRIDYNSPQYANPNGLQMGADQYDLLVCMQKELM